MRGKERHIYFQSQVDSMSLSSCNFDKQEFQTPHRQAALSLREPDADVEGDGSCLVAVSVRIKIDLRSLEYLHTLSGRATQGTITRGNIDVPSGMYHNAISSIAELKQL